MKSAVLYIVLVVLLSYTAALAESATLAPPAAVSPVMELSADLNDVDFSPRLPLPRPLLSGLSVESVRRIENPVDVGTGTWLWFNGEAEVESEGQSPSYWPVLGPILITVGVGTATWLLFTLRSS